MLVRYQDLVSLDLVASDGLRHRVEDVFVTEGDLRLAYVVAHVGGWFSGRSAIVAVERCGEPDIADTAWPCNLDEAALADAAGGAGSRPEAVLAPEGGPVTPDAVAGAGAALRSVGAWLVNGSVHASDGEAGSLMGTIFDTGDWRMRYLVVGTGGAGLSTNQRVVDAAHIERADFTGDGAAYLRASRAEIESSLDLHELDDVEGKWYNKVMAYYGLGT